MEVARNWELSSKIPWETGRYGMFEKTWVFSGFPVWWDMFSSLEVTNYLVGWVVKPFRRLRNQFYSVNYGYFTQLTDYLPTSMSHFKRPKRGFCGATAI